MGVSAFTTIDEPFAYPGFDLRYFESKNTGALVKMCCAELGNNPMMITIRNTFSNSMQFPL